MICDIKKGTKISKSNGNKFSEKCKRICDLDCAYVCASGWVCAGVPVCVCVGGWVCGCVCLCVV